MMTLFLLERIVPSSDTMLMLFSQCQGFPRQYSYMDNNNLNNSV